MTPEKRATLALIDNRVMSALQGRIAILERDIAAATDARSIARMRREQKNWQTKLQGLESHYR